MIVPVEQSAILRIKRNAKDSEDRYVQSKSDYKRGASDQSASDQAEADAQQASSSEDDSSSVWGTIGNIALTALAFI